MVFPENFIYKSSAQRYTEIWGVTDPALHSDSLKEYELPSLQQQLEKIKNNECCSPNNAVGKGNKIFECFCFAHL